MSPKLLVILIALVPLVASADELAFVNFENHPIRALDLSPDRRLLAVAHSADQRIQLFDISIGAPIAVGHVQVGIDPVSVRFRTNTELWVVNHISDSISIVDVPARRVRATVATADEPFDVVFAGTRAFVSASQVNQVQVFDALDPAATPAVVDIAGEDPRALAVSADGSKVYVAVFESGNASTILGGGLEDNIVAIPNVVSDPRGPYGGQNPPPNAGAAFDPPLDPSAAPPAVGLIVRKDGEGRWMDDNQGDWTAFVSGPLAGASGRVQGWDLADNDIAVIDVQTLGVTYHRGLLNIGMQLAVHPVSGTLHLIGTDASNEIRFEPNLNGRFLQVRMATVNAQGARQIVDLNPHIDYSGPRVDLSMRVKSVADPRALVWEADGARGWIAGMGSNNIISINPEGARLGDPVRVGEGPVGLAVDDARRRLYVWNHFEASLSVVDLDTRAEIDRIAVFNPLPQAIRQGRPLLYDAHLTSGLGQASCASCHVDARIDRLAWDLGNPALPPAPFDQNCVTALGRACEDFHAMKGPMTTQTLQDIIGHEPLHWRGDRLGIEAFNPAFEELLGAETLITASEMQAFKTFLATIHFPPNPYRNLDNSLPTALPLPNHYTSGRFAIPGLPLGQGNAVRGLNRFTRGLLDAPFQCAACHTLPTGMAVNGPAFTGFGGISAGGSVMAHGPNGENHLGVVSIDGSTNVSIKVPHLRNQYDKVGFELSRTDSTAGFGFLHDGSVDSLSRFMSARAFSVASDQDVADLVALMLAFSGSDFGDANPPLGNAAPQSRDVHAAAGRQFTLGAASSPFVQQWLQLATSPRLDLMVRRGVLGYLYDPVSAEFGASDGTTASVEQLQALAGGADPQTWTLVPAGLGMRLALDRDGDGVYDAVEILQGSDPADAGSFELKPRAGQWFNPARSGHGFDLQFSGPNMFILWYTYEDDGSPTWYLASAPYALEWRADLLRVTWDPQSGTPLPLAVGEISASFDSARSGVITWKMGTRQGSEPVQPLTSGLGFPLPDRTGSWFDVAEPGWGISVHSDGDVRLTVVYFYDAEHQPRWTLGQGSNAGSGALALRSYTGFCPDCPAVATSSVPAGSIEFDFDGARKGSVRIDTVHPAQPQARFQRGPVEIMPLSDRVLRLESR